MGKTQPVMKDREDDAQQEHHRVIYSLLIRGSTHAAAHRLYHGSVPGESRLISFPAGLGIERGFYAAGCGLPCAELPL